jgi:hypothetical protein
MVECTNLETKLHEQPIVLPGNPFLDGMIEFFRDEFTSGIVNVLSTTTAAYFLRGRADYLLAATGLTVEKIGLFVWHFKEAYDIYKTTPEKERKNFNHYFKNAIKSGMPSLIKDVTIHDPLDYSMLYFGFKYLPTTPAFMISATSFISSVILASIAEIGFYEARQKGLCRSMKKQGYGKESYYESRFIIKTAVDPEKVLSKLDDEFKLGEVDEWEYHDIYFDHCIPGYNGRTAQMRLRERKSADGKSMASAQVIFTKASEDGTRKGERKYDQFRYFLSRKEKHYFMLDSLPESIDSLPFFSRYASSKSKDFSFKRRYIHNGELLASVDNVRMNNPFYILELKVYSDTRLLKEAMRYAMMEFSPLQTTRNKQQLVEMNGNT